MPLKVQKESDNIKLSLKKNGLEGINIDVEFIGDVSGSMHGCYDKDEPMDIVMQKLLVFASIVDPDKELAVSSFSHEFETVGTYSVDDYESIHEKFDSRRNGGNLWGGTLYNCALKTLLHSKTTTTGGFFGKLFGFNKTVTEEVTNEKNTTSPKIVFFLTDGADSGDEDELYDTLQQIVDNTNTFVMFIGIGSHARRKLTQIDTDFDGIGTLLVDNISQLADDDFCDSIITTEFKEWYADVPKSLIK